MPTPLNDSLREGSARLSRLIRAHAPLCFISSHTGVVSTKCPQARSCPRVTPYRSIPIKRDTPLLAELCSVTSSQTVEPGSAGRMKDILLVFEL
jgi:hypothetical protein